MRTPFSHASLLDTVDQLKCSTDVIAPSCTRAYAPDASTGATELESGTSARFTCTSPSETNTCTSCESARYTENRVPVACKCVSPIRTTRDRWSALVTL